MKEEYSSSQVGLVTDSTLFYRRDRTFGPLDRSDNKPYPPLLAIEQMAAPLILRFRYHFDGKRPTNRLDKVRVWLWSGVCRIAAEGSIHLISQCITNAVFLSFS